jgi:putative chitinase
MITIEQLKAIMPGGSTRAARFIDPLNKAMVKFDIDTVPRMASFLAQIAHESGQLLYVQELASGDAYENRKDLGNTHPGDGRMFRGRGLIQITGRGDNQACADFFKMNLLDFLAWVIQDEGAAMASGWWWYKHNANLVADTGDELAVSRLVNCGSAHSKCTPNGLDKRLAFKAVALRVLGG